MMSLTLHPSACGRRAAGWRAWLAALGALAGLAGCASTPMTLLDGTDWTLTQLRGEAPVPGSTVTLAFREGRASGSDGCNSYTAPYQALVSSFELGGRAASTRRACAEPLMTQAQAYLDALQAARGYQRGAGELRLLDAQRGVLMVLAAQSQSLAGTGWVVQAVNNGRGGAVSVSEPAPTLAFGSDGRASGNTGCNEFGATFEQQGTSLRLREAVTTRRMCADPAVMEQEQWFLLALESATQARVQGDRLELRSADGALAVRLERR